MSARSQKRYALSAPTHVYVHLTDKCNFQCPYCFSNSKALSSPELTTDECIQFFRQCDAMHILLVRLFGGEPLIHKDAHKIITSMKQFHFSKMMTTNGSLLTKDIARSLRTSSFGAINVSLHGPDTIHDLYTGVPGSFVKVIQGIEMLKKERLRVAIQFVLSRANVEYLNDTLQIASDLGIDLFKIIPLSQMGRALDKRRITRLAYEEWSHFYFELTKKKISRELPFQKIAFAFFNCNTCPWEMFFPLPESERIDLLKRAWGIDLLHPPYVQGRLFCPAGIDCLALLSNGDIFPCDQMMHIPEMCAGNIRHHKLSRIWKHSPVFSRLRALTRNDLIGPCRNCPNQHCSGYNRGEAYFATGSILGSDVNCIRAKEFIS